MGFTPALGHVHIRGTDQHATLGFEDALLVAAASGYQAIHITPHFRDPTYPAQQVERPNIWEGDQAANLMRIAQDHGLALRIGIEVDILPDLDASRVQPAFKLDGPLPPPGPWPIIAACHFTQALWMKGCDEEISPHQSADAMVAAYRAIMQSYEGKIHVIGHPFRHGGAFTPHQVFLLGQAASIHGVAVEINIHQIAEGDHRLLQPEMLQALYLSGAQVYLGTDIHTEQQLPHSLLLLEVLRKLKPFLPLERFLA